MNLYLIEQSYNEDYDTYDSAVVVAESEDKAKLIHPCHSKDKKEWSDWYEWSDMWCDAPEQVTVTLIGVADSSLEEGTVILASFNAG